MRFRLLFLALAVVLVPGSAYAHDAFGNLGPFYQGLLHPLADPVQGLLLVAIAILLARQPVASVRKAYAVLLPCALLAAGLHLFLAPIAVTAQVMGALVAALGLLALTGVTLPAALTTLLAGGTAILAGLLGDQMTGLRDSLLAAAGVSLGIALLVLFAWCVLDSLQQRLGHVAGAVAASWVTAIGVMAAALPAALS